jgi:hypothetical protein
VEGLVQKSHSGFSALYFVLCFVALLSTDSLQAYKHVFTSPSSVDKENKATRSGNARIHGMTGVTPASLAYIATQVCLVPPLFFYHPLYDPLQTRFALSSSAVFSRSDMVTDSERFYSSILELFEDVEEKEEVNDLMVWWNR